MQEFLEYVVKGLVNHPEEVTVTPVAKDALTIYELRLHPGRRGQGHWTPGDDDQCHALAVAGGQRQEVTALLAGNCRGRSRPALES